ncbi:glycosyltransferase [candidate division KSB1 bacterium]|nr:glycosyltransferase [candidate division KSB1 bacterium]
MIAPQPFFQPRGTPFSILHRLKALSKLGYQIDLLTYHLGENVAINGLTIHRIPDVPVIKSVAIGPSKTKVVLDIFLFVKAVKMLAEHNYDLIHSHEEAGFFVTYLSRKFRTLHLYDMHSSLPQQLSNFKFSKSKLLLRMFEKLEAWTLENADAVITICPELFNYVEKRFPNKENTLIENVADNSLVFADTNSGQSVDKKIRSNGETVILYTGTFEPYQGIDLLIDASRKVVEKVRSLRFVLVGGKPEQVELYKKKVTELKLEGHFIFTGSVLPQEVPAYVAAADILVSPRVEGNNTPLKIYSYLRAGKPIVATNHITHTQVLNPDVSMLTDCTPEAFGNGVISLLESAELRQQLGENARKLAEEKYSYDSYLNKTKDVYSYLEERLLETKVI